MPTIEIVRDYDGAFEALVRKWIAAKGGPCKHHTIRINSGPYRPYAVSHTSLDGVLTLDFYSAFRMGFGSMEADEVRAMIELL